MSKIFVVLALIVSVLGTAACSVYQTTGRNTMTGAAAGAAGGAAIGLIQEDFFESALTGAAAGAASGFVYDQMQR